MSFQTSFFSVFTLILFATGCFESIKLIDEFSNQIPSVPGAVIVSAESGGEVTSADGSLTLFVPAGAVTQDTEILVMPVDPDSQADDWNDQVSTAVFSAWEMLPEGLHFLVPITAVFEVENTAIPSITLTNGTSLAGILSRTADGTFDFWGTGAQLQTEDQTAYGVELTHFSIFGLIHAAELRLSTACTNCQINVVYDLSARLANNLFKQNIKVRKWTVSVINGPAEIIEPENEDLIPQSARLVGNKEEVYFQEDVHSPGQYKCTAAGVATLRVKAEVYSSSDVRNGNGGNFYFERALDRDDSKDPASFDVAITCQEPVDPGETGTTVVEYVDLYGVPSTPTALPDTHNVDLVDNNTSTVNQTAANGVKVTLGDTANDTYTTGNGEISSFGSDGQVDFELNNSSHEIKRFCLDLNNSCTNGLANCIKLQCLDGTGQVLSENVAPVTPPYSQTLCVDAPSGGKCAKVRVDFISGPGIIEKYPEVTIFKP